jgi:hypothetical protein
MEDEFLDSADLLDDRAALLRRLRADGFLFFRGLLPAGAIMTLRREVVQALGAAGWLVPGSDPMEARPSPLARRESDTSEYFDAYRRLQQLQRFHELAHYPSLTGLMQRILGSPLLVLPSKMARISLPDDLGFTTPAHQDFREVQGTVDTLTAWVPLGDCPRALGGLKILAGSHRNGMLPARPGTGPGGITVDVPAGTWYSTDFHAGDVLLFHGLTVHAARPNRSGRLRLSADFRYQAADEPVAASSLRPHGFRSWKPSWEELTEGWSSMASVTAPDGVKVVPKAFDPLDPAAVAPASRLLGAHDERRP